MLDDVQQLMSSFTSQAANAEKFLAKNENEIEDGPKQIHNITHLPGYGDVSHMKMTSGYLPVGKDNNRHIFYW